MFSLPGEKEFLQQIKRFKNIGYGNMMSIISYQWYNESGDEAFTTGKCVGSLSKKDLREYHGCRESHPVFELDE